MLAPVFCIPLEVRVTPAQQENREANGLGIVMLFLMPVATVVLIGVITYLGMIVSGG